MRHINKHQVNRNAFRQYQSPHQWFWYLLLLAISSTSIAESTSTVDLNEYLMLLGERHPIFQQKGLELASQQAYRDSLLGAEDWVGYAESSAYQQEATVNGSGPDSLWGLSSEVGANRQFWSTGGNLSLSWNVQSNTYGGDSNYYPNNEKYGISQRVDVQYRHSLLGNRKGIAAREAWDLAGFQTSITELETTLEQEQFLLAQGVIFLQWQRWTDQKKVLLRRISLAKKQLNQVILRRKNNLVDKVDVLRSEESLRASRQSLALITAAEQELRTKILHLITFDNTSDTKPNFSLGRDWVLPEKSEAVLFLTSNDRQLKLYEQQKQQFQRRIETLNNKLHGDLSVGIGLALKKHENNFYDSTSLDRNDTSVSIRYEMPFENREVKKQHQRLLHQLQLLRVYQERYSRDIQANVLSLLSRISHMQNVLRLNRLQVEASVKTTKEEKRLYEHSRNDLPTVIQSQDNEQQAKLRLIDNATNYQTLVLQLESLLGRLVLRSKGNSGTLSLTQNYNKEKVQ